MERMPLRIIGLMSGTSMDGLDIVCVDFSLSPKQKWEYQVVAASTEPLPANLLQKLTHAKELNGFELNLLDLEFGKLSAELVLNFLQENDIKKESVRAIASHGHTVFHQPGKALTLQIGNGNKIAQVSGIDTICNFREKDVLNGGQGAPLVPIGDKLLFSHLADSFLNLGGFANITHLNKSSIKAFDICPCNLVLNYFAQKMGFEYDKNGNLGRSISDTDAELLEQLNSLPYYFSLAPKSLGTEWLEAYFMPLLNQNFSSDRILLRTLYEHLAQQIALNINALNAKKVLVTGGGAKNQFLIDLLRQKSKAEIVVPDEITVNFKEAIVFAFLGVLHLEKLPNCLAQVTGANKNVCGGTFYSA